MEKVIKDTFVIAKKAEKEENSNANVNYFTERRDTSIDIHNLGYE